MVASPNGGSEFFDDPSVGAGRTKPIDIGSLMDAGRANAHVKFLVALTALAVIFDGADIQMLAVAIPALMEDWNLPRGSFTNVAAAGLAGMMIGGAMAGVAGDRRRPTTLPGVSPRFTIRSISRKG